MLRKQGVVDNAISDDGLNGMLSIVGLDMDTEEGGKARISVIGVYQNGALRPLTQREAEDLVKYWDTKAVTEEVTEADQFDADYSEGSPM